MSLHAQVLLLPLGVPVTPAPAMPHTKAFPRQRSLKGADQHRCAMEGEGGGGAGLLTSLNSPILATHKWGGGFGTRPWWLALLACGGAYWPLAFEPSAMTSRHPYYCGHPHCRGHPPAPGGESRMQLLPMASSPDGLISASGGGGGRHACWPLRKGGKKQAILANESTHPPSRHVVVQAKPLLPPRRRRRKGRGPPSTARRASHHLQKGPARFTPSAPKSGCREPHSWGTCHRRPVA